MDFVGICVQRDETSPPGSLSHRRAGGRVGTKCVFCQFPLPSPMGEGPGVRSHITARILGAKSAITPAPLSYGTKHRSGRRTRGAGGEVNLPSNNRGFTVYIVLAILSIAILMISVLLLRINAVQKFSSAAVKKTQAYHLALSGVERASYFLSGGDNHNIDWECENYSEKIGDFGAITLQNRKYGVFAKLTSTGQ